MLPEQLNRYNPILLLLVIFELLISTGHVDKSRPWFWFSIEVESWMFTLQLENIVSRPFSPLPLKVLFKTSKLVEESASKIDMPE